MNRYFELHRMWLVKYTVSLYTITQNILKSQWELVTLDTAAAVDSRDWHYVNQLKPCAVAVWEVIHYEPGIVGVYAAHDPYAELYAVVPCTSCDRMETWRLFWGLTASSAAQNWLRTELGLELNTQPSWINLISI